MKKTYVKPMMESEEFVANEYVATCWTVECTECGAYEEGYGALKDRVKTAEYLYTEQSVIEGSLGNEGACKTYEIPNTRPNNFLGIILWIIFVDILGYDPGVQSSVSYHPVEATPNWLYTTNHPNASV